MRYLPRLKWFGLWVCGILLLSSLPGTDGNGLISGTAAAQEGAAAGGGTPAAGPADAAPTQSRLQFYFNALGIRYTVAFLLLSFVFVALIVMNALAIRRNSVVPPELMQNFESLLDEKRYQEAYELARTDESFLGQVLSAGLAKVQDGYPQALEAMQEVGEDETLRLEQRLSYIALIGTICPMVGLLGTVDGMVAAFQVIAASNTQPKPSELADGISMALITTLIGLFLAIPAIMIFGVLKNRMQRLVLEVGIFSERLMRRFESMGAKKP